MQQLGYRSPMWADEGSHNYKFMFQVSSESKTSIAQKQLVIEHGNRFVSILLSAPENWGNHHERLPWLKYKICLIKIWLSLGQLMTYVNWIWLQLWYCNPLPCELHKQSDNCTGFANYLEIAVHDTNISRGPSGPVNGLLISLYGGYRVQFNTGTQLLRANWYLVMQITIITTSNSP